MNGWDDSDFPGGKQAAEQIEKINSRSGKPCCIMDDRDPPCRGRLVSVSPLGVLVAMPTATKLGREKIYRESAGNAWVIVPWDCVERLCVASSEEFCKECNGESEEEEKKCRKDSRAARQTKKLLSPNDRPATKKRGKR